MGNYRTQLKLPGCPELSVNSFKSKAAADVFAAQKMKRPKRAKANFYPSFLPSRRVNAEFQRLMAVPLKERFMAQLDLHSSQLIRVIRAKGGATHQKIADIMDTLDQDIDGNDCQEEMSKMVLGIFVVRHERAEPTDDPEDIGIVLEGLEVMSELRSVPFAVAVLLGLYICPQLELPTRTQIHV
ncbi:hypothetical protein NFI96_029365 [Prochilodus magdalenae]|nr:hypothetical protein NFI96_029365 [Prochilodus magdalenae]